MNEWALMFVVSSRFTQYVRRVVLVNHHFPSSMNTPHIHLMLVSTEFLGQPRSSVRPLLLLHFLF